MGDDTLVSISNKGELLDSDDYCLTKDNEGNKIVWLHIAYLDQQGVGNMRLVFEFKSGIHKTLDIEITHIQREGKLRDSIVLDNKATMVVDTRINKEDWSNYDQSNDYSYQKADNVCIYYDGKLISGEEPEGPEYK